MSFISEFHSTYSNTAACETRFEYEVLSPYHLLRDLQYVYEIFCVAVATLVRKVVDRLLL